MPRPQSLLIAITLLSLGCASGSADQSGDRAQAAYYAYVGAESADLIHLIRFGPDGASVEKTIPVGELSVETEGPHSLMSSRDGEYLYMTTGHGFPDGKLWKFRTGTDTMVTAPVLLGRFPATVDLTPDGLYAFVANFNLHGEKVPSTISVVYTPDMIEVGQIATCTQPHGLRVGPRGTRLYTNCIQDDQLVEVDTRTFGVSRRFSVAVGHEGRIPDGAYSPEDHMLPGEPKSPSCAPTWAEPSPDGSKVYVACNRGDAILEVDTRDWVLLRTLPTGRGVYNLDISPNGKMLVGTLKQGAGVEFYDLESWRSVGIVQSSTTVTHGVAITPDSRFAFVSVEGVGAEPGKVDIYDLRSLQRVAEVEVGQQAGGIVFWRTERIDR
ncbi:MAG: YncE family protein [Gemmatimonadota bacterium]|nr:MAG: YncE family protein [Gemmatimonadota bacterium]